ncbi:MAG: (2Fe-2S)-binding protein [Sodalis sp. (in: enterobacteria)]|uniref:(2Fe-2S)-binding protein n=1 Tax=Sodalis sp. (in: enterobacteria) TaxID=1898979 RepID=UPI0039E60BB5
MRDIAIEQDAWRDERVLRCVSGGKTRTFRAQHIGLHEGAIPDQHVARALGCEFLWDAVASTFIPRRSAQLESSTAGVFIAGDAGGIGGYAVAEAEGRLAASVILHRLGKQDAAAMARECRQADRLRRRHLAARSLLDRLYAPAPEVLAPPDQTLICRCEEVSCGAVRDAMRQGASGPNQVKAFLRAGMGPCQGRLCAPTVAQLVATQRHLSSAQAGFYHIRTPLTPITVGELAALEQEKAPPDA